jgi:DNA-binding MarR family transcriptional regulator
MSTNKEQIEQPIAPPSMPAIGHLLRRAYQYNMTLFQRYCPDDQLTSVQLAALYAVNARQPCSLTDIGQIASIDPSTTRGVVDRLEKRCLIASEPDEEDGRRTLVRLTKAGKDLAREMVPIIDRLSEEMLAPLNPGERIALLFLLNKMLPEAS